MSCLVFNGTNDISVDTCPVDYVPVANRAVIAFTTRTTLYLQTLLVLFNGSIAAGLYNPESFLLSPTKGPDDQERRDKLTVELRRKANMNAFNILIAMNIALSGTSLVLAFAPMHTLDFYNGLVVIYLLVLCWFTVVSVAPFYLRLRISINSRVLRLITHLQTFLVFVYIFVLLARAKSFGPSFCCNQNAKAYFFHSFAALGGARTAGLVVSSVILMIYILLEFKAIRRDPGTMLPKKSPKTSTPRTSAPTRQPTGETMKADESKNTDSGREDIDDIVRVDYVPTELTLESKESDAGIEKEDTKDASDAERASAPIDENVQEFIKTAGSANLNLFFAYLVVWILIVGNTEMLIVRNGFSYDIRDDIKFSMASPAEFAQTLQFSEVLTFFVPFVHIHDTIQKVRATWYSARISWRNRRKSQTEVRHSHV